MSGMCSSGWGRLRLPRLLAVEHCQLQEGLHEAPDIGLWSGDCGDRDLVFTFVSAAGDDRLSGFDSGGVGSGST